VHFQAHNKTNPNRNLAINMAFDQPPNFARYCTRQSNGCGRNLPLNLCSRCVIKRIVFSGFGRVSQLRALN
jgi:hypothetical protein